MRTTKPCTNCPDTVSYKTIAASPLRVTPTATIPTSNAATCPECNGLESLCRPRFFDGQLLSADDLNRLERYILQKNRLQNRTLHGWGVVCGLEVVCDPCKDQLIVRPGYALSPCGDDIVVPGNVSVPICDLIKQCRNTAAYDDCYSGRLTAEEQGCEESLEDWHLLICYDEKPARGITPLRASSESSSCGCGGQEQFASTSAKTMAARLSPQCEPSVICEGFHFEVRKVPPQSIEKRKRPLGAMIDRFLECYRELFSILPEFPQQSTDLEQLRQYCCDLKAALKEFFTVHSTYSCLLDESLGQIVCPRRSQFSDDTQYQQALYEALQEEVMVAAEYLRYCLCAILQPPCPEPVAGNCVPIATVKIRRTDCKVIDVCNVTGRRFAVTMPNLAYWLSWIPIDWYLGRLLAKICCGTILKPDMEFTVGDMTFMEGNVYAERKVKMGAAAGTAKESTAQQSRAEAEVKTTDFNRDFASIFAQAWARGANRLDLPTLILDTMGASDIDVQPFLTAEEKRNPLTALLANQIAMPLAESFLPEDLMRSTNVRDLQKGVTGETPRASATEVEALKAEMSKLASVIDKQQKTINTLTKKVGAEKKTRKG